MINHQDVLMLCMAFKLPPPLWKANCGVKGLIRRGAILTCPTVNKRIVLKICGDAPKRLRGVIKAFRIGPFYPIYVWCRRTGPLRPFFRVQQVRR